MRSFDLARCGAAIITLWHVHVWLFTADHPGKLHAPRIDHKFQSLFLSSRNEPFHPCQLFAINLTALGVFRTTTVHSPYLYSGDVEIITTSKNGTLRNECLIQRKKIVLDSWPRARACERYQYRDSLRDEDKRNLLLRKRKCNLLN